MAERAAAGGRPGKAWRLPRVALTPSSFLPPPPPFSSAQRIIDLHAPTEVVKKITAITIEPGVDVEVIVADAAK